MLDVKWGLDDEEFARWHREKKYHPSRGHDISKEER